MFTTDYVDKRINQKLLQLHTAYLGVVKSIDGKIAMVKPLTAYKAIGGGAQEQSLAPAFIPSNIKYKTEKITYLTSNGTETKTILAPDNLVVGDIVLVDVCERDITHAKYGKVGEATNRHHDQNDGVIVRVV